MTVVIQGKKKKKQGDFAPPECTSSHTLTNESSRNSDLVKKSFDKPKKKENITQA